MRIGGTAVSKVYIGSTPITKIMIGATEVWSASTVTVTDEGDGTISVTWIGTLDEMGVASSNFNGPYTQYYDGTPLLDTHLDDVAGRAMDITATTQTDTTVTAGNVLVIRKDGYDVPTVSVSGWQRDGVAIGGASGTTYTKVLADEGASVRPVFTISNGTQTDVTENGPAVTGTLRTQATAASLLGPYEWDVDTAISGFNVAADFTANGNTLTYTATGLPTGLSIASNGDVSGTPTVVGTGSITFTGTDEYGRETDSTTTYEVHAAATPGTFPLTDSFAAGDGYALDDTIISSSNWATHFNNGPTATISPLGTATFESTGTFQHASVQYAGTISEDQSIEATIGPVIVNNRRDPRIMLRADNTGATAVGSAIDVLCVPTSSEIRFREIINDSVTANTVTVAHTIAQGDKIRVTVVGTEARLELDTGSGYSVVGTLTGLTITGGVPAFGAYLDPGSVSVAIEDVTIDEATTLPGATQEITADENGLTGVSALTGTAGSVTASADGLTGVS